MAMFDLTARFIGIDQTGAATKSARKNLESMGDATDRVKAKVGDLGDRAKASFGNVAKYGAAAAGALTVAFGVKAAKAASDLNESINAVNVTFGEAADSINALGIQSVKTVGLSRSQFNSLAVQFSNFATTVAGDGGDVSKVMADLTGRAADFASVMNMDVNEAAALFGSTLAGESEPIRRFGVDVSAAAVQANALAKGIWDGTGELTEQQKVLSRYDLLMQATTKTAGDFANTQGSMSNQLKVLGGNFENFAAAAGQALTPIAEAILPKVNDLLAAMADDINANLPEIQKRMGEFGAEVGAVIDRMGGWEQIKANLEGIAESVRRNWPEIQATFENVAGALERVGGFAQIMFDAFKSLPPEAQQMLALLAIASKTGALSLTVDMIGMGSTADGGKGKGIGKYVPVIGAGGVVSGVVLASAVLTGYALQQFVTGQSGENLEATKGNPNTLAGSWAAMGGTLQQNTVLPELTKQQAEYRDSLRETDDRMLVQQRVIQRLGEGLQGLGIVYGEMWRGLKTGAADAFTNVDNFFQGIGRTIQQSVSTAVAVVGANFTRMRQDVADRVSGIFTDVNNWFQGIGRSIQYAVGAAASIVAANFTLMKDNAVGKAREIWGEVTGWFTSLGDGLAGIFTSMVDRIGRIWDTVSETVKRPIARMFGWINVNMIIPINNVLGKFSDSIRLGVLSVGQYADGGYVTGPGGPRDDKVPALLSNGEFVVNAEATKANRVLLEAINAKRQGFGIGGPFDWLGDVLAKGAGAAVRFVGNPAMDMLDRLFGGEWSPNVVIAGMRNVLNETAKWGDREDAAVTGEYKGPRGAIQRPLNSYVVTSEWMRSGADMRHVGIDLGAAMGSPIFAAANGKVIPTTTANQALTGGYGIMATIDHGSGLKTLYAHMSKLAVEVGNMVRAGQVIGAVGSTGQSTGPHLHYETWVNGRPVNPRTVQEFDSGGWLKPGTIAVNNSGKPEPVFTNEQWAAMTSGGLEAEVVVPLNLDGQQVAEALIRLKRNRGGALLGIA